MHLGDPLAKICMVKLGENLLCPRVIPTLHDQATNVQLIIYQVIASMTHPAAFEETSHVPRPSAATLSSGERPGNEACEEKPNAPHCYV